MIQKRHLPNYDVSSRHQVSIWGTPNDIFPRLEKLDFSGSKLIYWLFKLRGIRVPQSMTLAGLQKMGFVLLEQRPPMALIMGLIGQFWTLDGSLKKFDAEKFAADRWPDQAKATWSFELEILDDQTTMLITETRVLCPDPKAKKRFELYWRLIGPFSGWIRKEILQSIKKQVEKQLPLA